MVANMAIPPRNHPPQPLFHIRCKIAVKIAALTAAETATIRDSAVVRSLPKKPPALASLAIAVALIAVPPSLWRAARFAFCGEW
jgi:hypothetical protein